MYAEILPKQFDAIKHLATEARKDGCDADELDTKVRQFCTSIAGVEGYAALVQDLRRASERFIKTDSFRRIGGKGFEYDPVAFAAFVEELLDGEKRAWREDLISDAWACGLNPYGLTAAEINTGVGYFLCADDDLSVADEILLEGTIEESTWNMENLLDAAD